MKINKIKRIKNNNNNKLFCNKLNQKIIFKKIKINNKLLKRH